LRISATVAYTRSKSSRCASIPALMSHDAASLRVERMPASTRASMASRSRLSTRHVITLALVPTGSAARPPAPSTSPTCRRTPSRVMPNSLTLAQQAEQDVLGADVVVVKALRLVPRQRQRFACPHCKLLKRRRRLSLQRLQRLPWERVPHIFAHRLFDGLFHCRLIRRFLV